MKSPIRTLPGDFTPEKAFRAISGRPYPFVLDGGSDVGAFGRHSYAGSDPFLVLHAKDGHAVLKYPRLGKTETVDGDPFKLLRALLKKHAVDAPGPFPMARGGAVGYFAYDLFKSVENLKRTAVDDLSMPDLFLGFYDRVYHYDRETGEAHLAEEIRLDEGAPPLGWDEIWETAPDDLYGEGAPAVNASLLKSNQTPEEFKNAILRAKEHIAAGDVYQVNLSQRFRCPYEGTPEDFFLRFRKTSPAPFGAYLKPDGFAVISNSPERYLLIDGGHIETRPIKGTRPRGLTPEEDEALKKELLESVKDRAEHLMIVDLERNDLGRVSAYNSVHVPEFMTIESYANVHHMVSTVAGTIHPSRDAVDCIRNSFPGGSITGAPKVWAIRIIDRLEPTARGVYCGSIGYLDFSGRVDLNIAIRTAVHKGGELFFQVGGGIVADSDPEEEYEETITKAQSFMKALTGHGRVWEE